MSDPTCSGYVLPADIGVGTVRFACVGGNGQTVLVTACSLGADPGCAAGSVFGLPPMTKSEAVRLGSAIALVLAIAWGVRQVAGVLWNR